MLQRVPILPVCLDGDCGSLECSFMCRQSRASSDSSTRCRRAQMVGFRVTDGITAPVVTPPGAGRATVSVIISLDAGGAEF